MANQHARPPRGANPHAEEKQFDERVIHIDRVARVVKGGRRFRFRALVVVGDHKGKVGIGVSKGTDVTAAIAKAVDVAKKEMHSINMWGGTIPHEVESKVSGAKILIKPAAPGTGLIAGGVVRTVLEVAGVHNALSKRLGNNNKVNTAYATLEALKSVVPADQWVTRQARQERPASAKNKTADTNNTEKTKKPTAKEAK